MKDTNYAYAVANVRAVEPQLLSKSFMEQLVDAVNFEEVKRSLTDAGALDFENSMIKTWDFLKENAPDISELEFLIVKNDFHNLKAIIKGMVAGADGSKYCIKPCVLDIDELSEKLVQKEFDTLPEWIGKTAKEGYDLLTSTMDGQLFDMLIDKASLRAVKKFAKRAESEFADSIAELFTALTNIKIAVRIAGTGKGEAFLDNAFCQCDTLDIEELKKASADGREDVVAYISTTQYDDLCDSIEKSMMDFERECDNKIMGLLDGARRISLGPEPLICYYFAKETEWKMLRIIVNGKHIELDSQSIRERMRELYV